MFNHSEQKIEYRKSLEELWRRYSETIYKLCVVRCNSAEEAKDLFQTVALKFCENIEQLSDREDMLPWLISVMRHTHLDLRIEKNRTLCMSGYQGCYSEYASFCEEESMFYEGRPASELLYAMEKTLERVTPLERMLVEMKFYGGFSVRELSNIFGLSENAVRKRRFAALRKMKRMMEEWFEPTKMAQ